MAWNGWAPEVRSARRAAPAARQPSGAGHTERRRVDDDAGAGQREIAELRATAAGTSAMATRRYTIDGGLPLGSRAPDLPLMTPDGQLVTLRPAPGPRLLVLFLESGCPPCERLMPAVARWQRDERPSSLDVALVCGEQASTAADIVRRHGKVDAYAQPDSTAPPRTRR
jgi:thiol-disulfide isomerase/thioredoxin